MRVTGSVLNKGTELINAFNNFLAIFTVNLNMLSYVKYTIEYLSL